MEVKELVVVEITTPVRYLKYLVNVHLFEARSMKYALSAALEEVFKELDGVTIIEKVSTNFVDYDSMVTLNKITGLIMGEPVVLLESINRLEA